MNDANHTGAPGDHQMPDQIGKYRVDMVLGQGAMGVVYKAFDPYINRTVALKTIRSELLHDQQEAELVARFRNEAQASGRLSHPNIVAVYEYGEIPEGAFIAMEFVEGTPLNLLLVPSQPTALATVMGWMTQLLRALAYAHVRGVVHRDIKPANLIITAEAQVKITDFGIARIESSTLTQTGSMIGTPSYMSPEQFRGAAIDGRSDVFSSGILLYQLLTGSRPFVGNASSVMHQILYDKMQPAAELNPALGSRFDQVLECALAKEPADRFASAELFLQALMLANAGGPTKNAIDPPMSVSDSDRTVIAVQARDAGNGALLSTNPAASQTSGSTADTFAPWKLEVFPELEGMLSRQIGPIAKILLKKAGARANNVDELGNLLLAHIPSESGRAELVQKVAAIKKRGAGPPQTVSRLAKKADSSLTSNASDAGVGMSEAPVPADFAPTVEKILTRYIGAIAKIVIKRAIGRCTGRDNFLELVSQAIESEVDRKLFHQEIINL